MFPSPFKNIIVNENVFTFDHVLGPQITQKEIFDRLIKPLVVNLKLGFNCTALAYGQTGTGKSYTMGLNSKVILVTMITHTIDINIFFLFRVLMMMKLVLFHVV